MIRRHDHDCLVCEYLGSVSGPETPNVMRDQGYPRSKISQDRPITQFDLYYCPRDKTLIARFGKDGDYMSHTVKYRDHTPEHPALYWAWILFWYHERSKS